MGLKTKLQLLAALCLAAAGLSSCGKEADFIIEGPSGVKAGSLTGTRAVSSETRRVLLFYECGLNSLSGDLDRDMNVELVQGYDSEGKEDGKAKAYIPAEGRSENVLLVFTKLAEDYSYSPVKSYLKRLYLNSEGRLVRDTLKIWDESFLAASKEGLGEVLSYVRKAFPAKGYGLVFSSHGSGWLPEGYYFSPSSLENPKKSKAKAALKAPLAPDALSLSDPFYGLTRSIGNESTPDGDREMSVADMAEAIPMRLDYLLFDMCFSGGIELVWGLRNKTRCIGASPAEVLADGMYDYSKITSYLLEGDEPRLKELMEDSFARYDKRSGLYRSATVTLLRTEGLEKVAAVCKELFEKYRSELAAAPYSQIQGYHRLGRHFFYDLVDMLAKSGVPQAEVSALEEALAACTVYKASTPGFLGEFSITSYSGLSCYLPAHGTALLDSWYRKESWNQATALVK